AVAVAGCGRYFVAALLPDPPLMSMYLRVAAIAAVILVAGCATPNGTSRPGKVAATSGDAAVDALYARLDGETRRYQAGLDAARKGDQATARRDMTTALD